MQEESNDDISDDNKDHDKISLNHMENEIHEKNLANLVNEIKEIEIKIKRENNEKKFRKKFTPRITMPKIELTVLIFKQFNIFYQIKQEIKIC